MSDALTERNQLLQRAHDESELRRSELEEVSDPGGVGRGHQPPECVCDQRVVPQSLKQQRREAEAQAERSAQRLQRDTDELQSAVTQLQVAVTTLQGERAEMRRALAQLAKDKAALRRTLEEVRRSRGVL